MNLSVVLKLVLVRHFTLRTMYTVIALSLTCFPVDFMGLICSSHVFVHVYALRIRFRMYNSGNDLHELLSVFMSYSTLTSSQAKRVEHKQVQAKKGENPVYMTYIFIYVYCVFKHSYDEIIANKDEIKMRRENETNKIVEIVLVAGKCKT